MNELRTIFIINLSHVKFVMILDKTMFKFVYVVNEFIWLVEQEVEETNA
jgi:hypothetical protein